MTRSELIQRMAQRFPQLTHADIQASASLIIAATTDALAQGRRVELRGFGSFSVHYRPAKLARNPKTGEPVPVPEKHVPHFKPGNRLLDAIQPIEAG